MLSQSTSAPPGKIPAAGEKTWRTGTLVYTSAGIGALFFWLLFGDFALSMRERSVGPMSYWYLTQLHIPNLLFGLLLSSLPAAISFFLMPIVSVKSDSHRGRWGRRIPFLLITMPLAACGTVGIGITPLLAGWLHGRFPGLDPTHISIVCFTLFWTFFDFASIAGVPLFGGLVNDVVPKELLGRFYGLFRAISLIDGMIFNHWIIGHSPDHFTLILVSIGLFYGAAFVLVCLKIKEGAYPPPPPPDEARRFAVLGFCKGAARFLRDCFSKPYYLCVFAMLTLALLTFSPVNAFAMPYANSLGIGIKTYGDYLALTFLISLTITYFIGWLVDAFHPLRMVIVTLAIYAAVTLGSWFFVTTDRSFLFAWVAHGVISGCFYTSVASLSQRLFPREKFAQFASASAMVMAPCNIVFAPLIGRLIDVTGRAYHYTFLVGFALAAVSLCAALVVHRQFMRLGGPRNYAAPA